MRKGCPYGSHRVVEPEGLLPQAALKLDNTMELYDNEIMVDVATLNVDSASFTQMEDEAGGDEAKIGEMIMATVARHGKQQNPVTGSGGVLIGTVAEVGPRAAEVHDVRPGDEIVTLVSLSMTPLKLERIVAVHPETDQVDVAGRAIHPDDADAVEAALAEMSAGTVVIQADRDVPTSLLLRVLDTCKAGGAENVNVAALPR